MTLIVTWLWQGLAIAWITAAAVWAMPRLNAATRHVIWWLALAAVLAIPVAHGVMAITTGAPPAPGLTGPLDAAGALVVPAFPAGVVAGAAALWAMSAATGLVRIARSYRTVRRLKRTSSPFDDLREVRLPLWVTARDGGHRPAELRISDWITGACALGLGRPVILVSRSVADALGDDSLDEIVMHEQAHLDRFDDWSQLLQAVVGSLAGLHPAVRFLARRLDVDREAACDDRVVSCTGAARHYASSLLTAAAASNPEVAGVEFAATVPTATTTASALRVRVGRLLDPRRDRSTRLPRTTTLATVTALTLAVVMSAHMDPLVVVLETAVAHIPAAAATPATAVLGAPELLPRPTVYTAAEAFKRPPRRTLTQLKRPEQSNRSETIAFPFAFAATTPDVAPAAPLDSRSTAADAISLSRIVAFADTGWQRVPANRCRGAVGSSEDIHGVCRHRFRARRCGDR